MVVDNPQIETKGAPPPDRARRKRATKWFRTTGWRHLVAWVALAFAMFPIIWVVSASFNPQGSLNSQTLIPDTWTLENYRNSSTTPTTEAGISTR